MTSHLTEPCKACSGSGLVTRERRRLPNGELDPRDSLVWPEVICETCNGSGQVPIQPEAITEHAPS